MAKKKKVPRKAPDLGRTTRDDEDEVPAGRPGKPVTADDEDEYFGGPVGQSTEVAPANDEDDEVAVDQEPEESSAGTDEGTDYAPVAMPRRKQGTPVGKGVTVSERRVISLDTRKLGARAKSQLAEWHGRNRSKKLDSFFAGHVKGMRAKFGHSAAMLGSETDNLVLGIPCPSLAFEFVIAQDCFPLGLVIQLVAKAGTGKSGLLAEFGRWFDMAGGGMSLQENETKFNPEWYRSVMGPEAYDRMELNRCSSVEDWQRKLTHSMKTFKTDMLGTKEAPGPGRTVPILFGVDSIMGKQSEEVQEQIFGSVAKDGKRGKPGQGHASRGHPIEAQVITRYMRTIPQMMDNWPFSLVLVNHLRMKQDDAGNPERSKTGGEQLNFQESFELELAKVGGHRKKIECADFEGFPVQISCEKNSFGPTLRKIQSRVLWWEETDEETGEWVQRTVWDWDWSTVHLLNQILHGDKSNPKLKEALKEIDFHLDCPTVSDIENSAWSKTLGMKKDDALPWSAVGAMIREDKNLVDLLRKALRINRRPLLDGDYLKQMETLGKQL